MKQKKTSIHIYDSNGIRSTKEKLRNTIFFDQILKKIYNNALFNLLNNKKINIIVLK